MADDQTLPPLPPGSREIATWAQRRRFRYAGHPDQAWFHGWEPFDTMNSASYYFNSVSWAFGGGTATVAEPWLAPVDSEPLGRTLLAFVSHPQLFRRAAARGGEHFNTRVAFLENPPPPKVTLDDPDWDPFITTFAASGSEAAAAFPRAARQLLKSWGFVGHLEIRPGGLIFHHASLQPTAAAMDRLFKWVPELVTALTY